jgi:cobalt-precorrin 5A hydrolase
MADPEAVSAARAGAGRIAVGLGCRVGCAPEQVLEVVQQVLAAHGRSLAEVAALHTADFKRAEPALERAAALLHKPLVGFSLEQLRAFAAGALSQSAHTLERFGVPSIAETAALAGAAALAPAQGGARLLAARSNAGCVSCALAEAQAVASPHAELGA